VLRRTCMRCIFPPLDDVVGWLAAMQPYGVPTRFLDWSYSAYVALFFAVENPTAEEFAALWAIRTDTVVQRSRELVNTLLAPSWSIAIT